MMNLVKSSLLPPANMLLLGVNTSCVFPLNLLANGEITALSGFPYHHRNSRRDGHDLCDLPLPATLS